MDLRFICRKGSAGGYIIIRDVSYATLRVEGGPVVAAELRAANVINGCQQDIAARGGALVV